MKPSVPYTGIPKTQGIPTVTETFIEHPRKLYFSLVSLLKMIGKYSLLGPKMVFYNCFGDHRDPRDSKQERIGTPGLSRNSKKGRIGTLGIPRDSKKEKKRDSKIVGFLRDSCRNP